MRDYILLRRGDLGPTVTEPSKSNAYVPVRSLHYQVLLPGIWRRVRQIYELVKLKLTKSISKSIKLPIFKSPGELSRQPSLFAPNGYPICVDLRVVSG